MPAAKIGPLAAELPKLCVDETGIIWHKEGEDLHYGFALEITGGTDISLAGSDRRNQIAEGLRTFLRSLEEGIYVQIIYDRSPATVSNIDGLFTSKQKSDQSGIVEQQQKHLKDQAQSEKVLQERVIFVIKYPLKGIIYKPWSIFRRADDQRIREAKEQLALRKEAIGNHLRAVGIVSKPLSRADIERFLFETYNPNRATSENV